MKLRFAAFHPGPMRGMAADPGHIAIVIAIGFVVLGILGLPIYRGFFIGALMLGAAVSLLFRYTKLRDGESEPGTTRMIHVDTGFLGILIAIGLMVWGCSVFLSIDGSSWELWSLGPLSLGYCVLQIRNPTKCDIPAHSST